MPCRAENHDDGHKYKTKKQVKYQRRFVLYRFHVAKIGLSHSFRKDNAQRSFTNILSLFTLSPFIQFKIRIFADIRDHEQRYEALIIISGNTCICLVFVRRQAPGGRAKTIVDGNFKAGIGRRACRTRPIARYLSLIHI